MKRLEFGIASSSIVSGFIERRKNPKSSGLTACEVRLETWKLWLCCESCYVTSACAPFVEPFLIRANYGRFYLNEDVLEFLLRNEPWCILRLASNYAIGFNVIVVCLLSPDKSFLTLKKSLSLTVVGVSIFWTSILVVELWDSIKMIFSKLVPQSFMKWSSKSSKRSSSWILDKRLELEKESVSAASPSESRHAPMFD